MSSRRKRSAAAALSGGKAEPRQPAKDRKIASGGGGGGGEKSRAPEDADAKMSDAKADEGTKAWAEWSLRPDGRMLKVTDEVLAVQMRASETAIANFEQLRREAFEYSNELEAGVIALVRAAIRQFQSSRGTRSRDDSHATPAQLHLRRSVYMAFMPSIRCANPCRGVVKALKTFACDCETQARYRDLALDLWDDADGPDEIAFRGNPQLILSLNRAVSEATSGLGDDDVVDLVADDGVNDGTSGSESPAR